MKSLLLILAFLTSITSALTSEDIIQENTILTLKEDLNANRPYQAWGRDDQGQASFKTFYSLDFSCFNENGILNASECNENKISCLLDIARIEQPLIIEAGYSFEVKEVREISYRGSRFSIPSTSPYYVISMGSLGSGTIRTLTCSRTGSSKKIESKELLKVISTLFYVL